MTKRKSKNWHKSTLRLKQNHSWKAPDGYKIVVLDRGAVSFNVPADWVVAETDPFEMHDQEPPDDEARLTVSFWNLPPGVDWSGLPLDDMLLGGLKDSNLEVLEQGDLVRSARDDMEIIWMQERFLDPDEKREAFTRMALARGWDIQALMTLDFWVDDAETLWPMWDELLRSLQLGRTIEDPTRGAVLH